MDVFGQFLFITVRNEVAKVMFLHLCQSFCYRGEGGLPQCMLGYNPPEQTPPPEQASPGSRHPLEQAPPMSRHPSELAPPWSRHPPEQAPPWSRHPPGPDTPSQTATAADGTHPTGMHSCLQKGSPRLNIGFKHLGVAIHELRPVIKVT